MNIKLLKRLPPLILLVVVCSGAFAQDESKFSAGAKVLGNVTKFQKTDYALGYGAGGFANYQILDFLGVRGELLYVSTATGLDSYTSDLSAIGMKSVTYKSRTLRFNSLEIPVLVQYSLPLMESLSPKLYAGGSYSWNFAVFENNDKTYVTGDNMSYQYKNTYENVGSTFKQYNTSLIGGVQVSFDVINIDLRYQQGFPDLKNFNTLGSDVPLGDFKSRTLTVSVGMKIF